MQLVSINRACEKHTAMRRESGEGSSHSAGHVNKGINAGLGDHGLERVLGDASDYQDVSITTTRLGIADRSGQLERDRS
jgi:hypothetical protein